MSSRTSPTATPQALAVRALTAIGTTETVCSCPFGVVMVRVAVGAPGAPPSTHRTPSVTTSSSRSTTSTSETFRVVPPPWTTTNGSVWAVCRGAPKRRAARGSIAEATASSTVAKGGEADAPVVELGRAHRSRSPAG